MDFSKQISGYLIPILIMQGFELWKSLMEWRNKDFAGEFWQIWELGREWKESLKYYRTTFLLTSSFLKEIKFLF